MTVPDSCEQALVQYHSDCILLFHCVRRMQPHELFLRGSAFRSTFGLLRELCSVTSCSRPSMCSRQSPQSNFKWSVVQPQPLRHTFTTYPVVSVHISHSLQNCPTQCCEFDHHYDLAVSSHTADTVRGKHGDNGNN